VCWDLPAELLDPLRRQAELESVPVDVVTARVLAAGLIELGWMPYGRCSVRTGLCGGGPAPLPIQQQSTCGQPI
jgi:hypothetical protein